MVRIHAALVGLAGMEAETVVEAVRLVPAVPIKKSIMPDYIVSLEDGRKYKSLTRYLRSNCGMTPVEYRMKWGLPDDLPDGGPELCQIAVGTRQADGARAGPQANSVLGNCDPFACRCPPRHCERSEAIQLHHGTQSWIASLRSQ